MQKKKKPIEKSRNRFTWYNISEVVPVHDKDVDKKIEASGKEIKKRK
jgi:hypothetical protein